ncbi:hypothetical protein IJ135_00960 [Candidatus Saccharibacteria bacterium]|nr:hypothetical protein [Candidatus Saccharibacteria bacterium]
MNILDEFRRIYAEEIDQRQGWTKFSSDSAEFSAEDFYRIAKQLMEVAKSSLVLRSYVNRYGLSNAATADESVGAHTNLVLALIDKALDFYYGPTFGEPDGEFPRTLDGYSYREITEAVRLHDLPENEIGDIPDNGSGNEFKKRIDEDHYYATFMREYPEGRSGFAKRVKGLIDSMNQHDSLTGRMIYMADKTAAILITLTYDSVGASPVMSRKDEHASPRDLEEMNIADWVSEDGFHHRASEMWTIDHLRIRKLSEYDDTQFFVAIIIMYTLMVNGKWYDWREEDYRKH